MVTFLKKTILMWFIVAAHGSLFAQLSVSFSVESDKSVFCTGDTLSFINESSGYDYCKWDFGNGIETYVINPKHIYTESGTYTVLLQIFDTDGNSTSSETEITAEQSPRLILTPADTVVIYEGSQITLTAEGDFSDINWSNGSSENTISVTSGGIYLATAYSPEGCITQDSLVVITEVVPQTEVQISVTNNILTPNGDGINDFLVISDFDKLNETCSVEIFSTSGQKVFSDDAYQNNWNGKDSNGNPLKSGTYYYIINLTGRTGGTGFIDIVR